MAGSIKLSPKHGLNPMMGVCFWCGEPDGTIALMGKIGGRGKDDEAPRYGVVSYEPCDKCKEGMAKGITLTEVSVEPMDDNQPPIQDGFYPTGRWLVVSEEYVRRCWPEDMAADVLKKRKCFVQEGILASMIGNGGDGHEDE